MAKFRVREKDVLREAKTTESHLGRVTFLTARAALLPGLKGALCQANNRVVSDSMAMKIAGSGLSISHLALAFRRNKEDGIRQLFSQLVDGKPRVTKHESTIVKVNSFFKAKDV